jgi:hypothetical protein
MFFYTSCQAYYTHSCPDRPGACEQVCAGREAKWKYSSLRTATNGETRSVIFDGRRSIAGDGQGACLVTVHDIDRALPGLACSRRARIGNRHLGRRMRDDLERRTVRKYQGIVRVESKRITRVIRFGILFSNPIKRGARVADDFVTGFDGNLEVSGAVPLDPDVVGFVAHDFTPSVEIAKIPI